MAVSGLPEQCDDHARSIARLALDLIDAAKGIKDPDGNQVVVSDCVK